MTTKEYKVIKVKTNPFKMDFSENTQEILNREARMGWQFEQLSDGTRGIYLVFSRAK
jgi:hypothetical protein